jgi:cellulose synthase operon protein C
MVRRGVTMAVACAVVVSAAGVRADAWRLRLEGPAAAEALSAPDAAQRREAAQRLGRHGDGAEAVQALARALGTERDASVRQAILEALARRGHPSSVSSLAQALATADEAGRSAAALALAAIGDAAALRALVDALTQPRSALAARRALLRAGAPAVPHLVRALSSDGAAEAAAALLGRLGSPLATGALMAASTHERGAVRLHAVRALGQIGDDRAVRAVVARLDDASDDVQRAAVVALGAVGTAVHAPLLAERATQGADELRRLALEAWLRLEPASAREPIAAALEGGAPFATTVAELVLDHPHPVLVPILEALLREGDLRAADALARVDRGKGLPALVLAAAAKGDPAKRSAVVRSLAVALRRWEAEPGLARAQARHALTRALEPGDERSWVLASLARLPDAGAWAAGGLDATDPARRSTAAHALGLLGDRRWARRVLEAALRETDPEAFVAMARVAAELGARAPLGPLLPRMRERATAPEALVLAARSVSEVPHEDRRRLRRELRNQLRADDPRVRAASARALAEAGDAEAWRAVVHALDDAAPEVRLAAARCLAVLGVVDAEERVRARLRIEEDPWVRRALEDAAAASLRGRPLAFVAQGEDVLRVTVASEGDAAGVRVDAVLADGRWLRLRTLPSGELFLADLPAGSADLHVRLAP